MVLMRLMLTSFIFILFVSCSSHQTEVENKGVLKELYQDQYFAEIAETYIRIRPANPTWTGYRSIDTEPERVSFLVRAALVEVNNSCSHQAQAKIMGKPSILKTKSNAPSDKIVNPTGVEIKYRCLKR
jgi:hypothetical protein